MKRKLLDSREVKLRADLVALARGFTQLRWAGREFVGLCPLHRERHPSFYINPEKQVFHCFGCGAGGDIFVFVMRAVGCSFPQALEIVDEFAQGVARDSEPRSGSRFGASEGGFRPLSPPKAGAVYSQSLSETRAQIIASLDATARRLRAIQATNRAASAALATPCEPRGTDESPLLEKTG